MKLSHNEMILAVAISSVLDQPSKINMYKINIFSYDVD